MIFFATSRHTAITPCASGAQAVPLARSLTLWPCWSPTGWPTIISVTRCPLRCPPQAADPSAVESGNSRQRYQLLGPARRPTGRLQRTANVIRGFQLSPALFRQDRRTLCGEESLEGSYSLRLSQPQNGISPAA